MTNCLRKLPLLLALIPVPGTAAGPASGDEPRNALKANSRTPYVHRLTLYDEDGAVIDPNDPAAGPYSPRMTCGKCHPYATISHGWHFNLTAREQSDERRGEPWWLVDEQLELAVPVSDRGWRQTLTSRQMGLDAWQMVKRFGRHLPGGGYGEPTPEQIEKSPHAARWRVSGPLEIDCMICHSTDDRYDPAERARQIERENFRWAATAALGLAVVRGEAAKLPDDFDPLAEPDPDNPTAAGPQLEWDLSRFDADNRVFFAITKRPPDERCYYCHTVRQVGQAHELEEMLEPRDVHLAAGLTCVDCHRNMMDHQMVRGYDGEAEATGQPWRAAFSCRGCHLGVEGAEPPGLAAGGRYGAPRPKHYGFPELHFEKLACTACHSGPRPVAEAGRFQTARAHGLGLARRGRSDHEPPLLFGPMMAERADGKIAPHLGAWASAYLDRGAVVDLATLQQRYAAASKADPTAAPNELLAQFAGSFHKVAFDPAAVYETLSRIVEEHEEGEEHEEEEEEHEDEHDESAAPAELPLATALRLPVTWPLAHDVRPASQALGAGGCTDCHTDDGPLFAGSIVPAELAGDKPLTNLLLRGEPDDEMALWNKAFAGRPVFKAVLIACVALVGLVLLRGLLDGLTPGNGRAGRGEATESAGEPCCHRLLHALLALAIVVQAVTGLGGEWFGHEAEEWMLLVHLGGAGLFAVTLTAVGLLWGRRLLAGNNGVTVAQRAMFWLGLLVGWAIMLPMLAAMLAWLTPEGIEEAAEVHEVLAIVLLVVMGLHTIVSLVAKRAK